MDNVILIGMPGSGKSSVGVVLAKVLGFGFLDADLLIQEREGALLQEILDTRGVEDFLDLECDTLCSIQCRRTVIAPGGSCVCRQAAMEHLRSLGTVIYLRLSLRESQSRINNLATRGVALTPGQTIADIYRYRVPLYEQYAHVSISCDGQTLTDTVEAVRELLASDLKYINARDE